MSWRDWRGEEEGLVDSIFDVPGRNYRWKTSSSFNVINSDYVFHHVSA